MTLYLLRYNNYFNRIAKREATLGEYLAVDAQNKPLYQLGTPLNNINFNPNDGVTTSQVINWNYEIPDYLLVVDNDGEINSRWFVVESVRERMNQFTLSLKRDLIIDYYDAVVKAPIYLQRAMINTGSSFIFNSENMLFNQIKKNEIDLADETNCRWIVGYCATNAFDEYTPEGGSPIRPGEIVAQPKLLAQNTSLNYEDILSYSQKGITSASANSSVQFSIYYNLKRTELDYSSYKDNYDFENGITSTDDLGYNETSYLASISKDSNMDVSAIVRNERMKPVFQAYGAALKQSILEVVGSIPQDQIVISQSDIDALLANQNKVLRDPNGKIFVYSMTRKTSKKKEYTMEPYSSGSLFNTYYKFMQLAKEADAYYMNAYYDEPGFSCSTSYESYEITLSFSPEVGYKTTLSTNSRNLLDAPYKMFAIPYDKLYWANYEEPESEGVPFNRISDPIACRAVAAQIAQNLSGSGSLYDIQLLPYCPIRGYIDTLLFPSGTSEAGPHEGIALPYDVNKVFYSSIIDNTSENEKTVGFVAFAETDSFSFTIDHEISVPTDNVDFKIEHETSMYRLNGPNYNGSFEFKTTSNRGLKGFEVNCTYKPYQPYIHVNPMFNDNGLYGGDFNDARGLICSGDFSLPTITDSWKTYQIQNKAYSDSFNREIENMDAVYDIERDRQVLSATISGIGGSLGTGLTAGIATGNPLVGAAIGIGSGIANIAGATKDIEYSDRLHDLSKEYKQDMFNLNLRNIQAKPYTLNKTGGININNKKYPFLEYYTASDEEKAALRSKIQYNSMTINAIGSIENYKTTEPSFIQGQCIRLNDIDDDSHIAVQIAYELNKGYYI